MSVYRPITKSPVKVINGGAEGNLTLPRDGLLFHARFYDADAARILDRVGTLDLVVLSGTTWADFVVTAPVDAVLIAADDGTLYTGGVPNEIDATARAAMTGNQFFFHEREGLAMYDAALTGSALTKVNKYFNLPVVYTDAAGNVLVDNAGNFLT